MGRLIVFCSISSYNSSSSFLPLLFLSAKILSGTVLGSHWTDCSDMVDMDVKICKRVSKWLNSCLTTVKNKLSSIVKRYMRDPVKNYFGLLKIQVKF